MNNFSDLSESIQTLNSEMRNLKPPRNALLADYQYEVICNSIREFEKELDNNHEIAFKLTSFGQSILLNVTKIAYSNPSIIQFYGYVDGNYAELIQHVTQLNFLIMAVKKDDPNRKPRRIGFIQSD